MEDKYAFDDIEFYDGPEAEDAKQRQDVSVSSDQLLAKLEQMFGPLGDEPLPAPEPVWHNPLLTPEEFMAMNGLKG
jgi:hypothetical protein